MASSAKSVKPRMITLDEVSGHRTKKDLWMVIHNDVVDISSFVEEHPGGEEVLLDMAGQDASRAFEDVGHSHDARELVEKFKIGWLPPPERTRFVDSLGKETPKSSEAPSKDKDKEKPKEKKGQVRAKRVPSRRSIKTAPHNLKRPRIPPPYIREHRQRSRRRTQTPPSGSSSSKWKWAILVLAVAIIAGVAYKKYSSK